MGGLILSVSLLYILVAYGACNVIAFSEGPFYIFSRIREWANDINEHFGKAFKCMICLPANFGWICSLVNYFFIPITFTPFNMVFKGYDNLWWLAALCDGALTSGIVYLIHILSEYIEKRLKFYEQNIVIDENDVEGYDSYDNNGETLIVDDITLKDRNEDLNELRDKVDNLIGTINDDILFTTSKLANVDNRLNKIDGVIEDNEYTTALALTKINEIVEEVNNLVSHLSETLIKPNNKIVDNDATIKDDVLNNI